MKSYKLWFCTVLLVISSVFSYIFYHRGINVSSQKAAEDYVQNETYEKKKENVELRKDNNAITDKIEDMEKEIEKITEKDGNVLEYKEKMSEYQTKILQLKKDISALDSKESADSKYAGQIASISNAVRGSAKKYSDTSIDCPEGIKAGRYLIKGTGSFRIINKANNNITESQNLKNLDDNSYTAVISENCQIIIDGTLSFTEVN